MIEKLFNRVKACQNTMEKLITMCTETKGRKSMPFRISDNRFLELLNIEEEVNCDIGAGYAGAYLPEFLADPIHF